MVVLFTWCACVCRMQISASSWLRRRRRWRTRIRSSRSVFSSRIFIVFFVSQRQHCLLWGIFNTNSNSWFSLFSSHSCVVFSIHNIRTEFFSCHNCVVFSIHNIRTVCSVTIMCYFPYTTLGQLLFFSHSCVVFSIHNIRTGFFFLITSMVFSMHNVRKELR